jgi:uncharacterized protein YndB with AHSA1/START domain
LRGRFKLFGYIIRHQERKNPMQTITVQRTIKAPIEKIFDMISDHANYKQFPAVSDSRLLKLGSPGRNGVGAVRWVKAGLANFDEEITRYERPTRMDYLITRSFPPLRHQGGTVRLEKTPDGTQVTWTTTMEAKIPVLGPLLTPVFAGMLRRSFGEILQYIEQQLTA